MKYSIRRQITAIFIGLLVFILGGVLVINTGFLGTYYLSHKSQELMRTYSEVDRIFVEGKLTETSSLNNILIRTEKANVDLVVVDAGGNAVFSTLGTEDPRFKEMTVGLLMGIAGVNVADVIRQSDAYTIYRDDAQGVTGDVEYLKMRGRLSDGSWFIMQSPLASIQESASLANRFLIYLGVIGIIFGGILIWLFSRRITQPVMELARLSQEMANLNFEARYTRNGEDEIGVLGRNFNRMSAQLEKTVSELKRANNRLQKDIEQKEKIEDMRNEFLGNVSHELKTPLTSIIGSADLLDNNLVKPEDVPRFVGHIRKEATRLLNLIEDIIRLSQLDEGEQLAYETVDLAQIALEATEQLQDAAVQHRVALRLETIPCPLHSVARLLHEIVYNLTENAIKYNVPDGKVVITVSREEDEVCLQVMDTGIGIPAEYQDRVFERFYRVDKSHSKASGGTGLGLSIVKHAAQRLGARITLQSVPGRGTTVTVCFPQ